jgi:hypothetical protein
MYIGRDIWNDEDRLRAAFRWLTRTGAGSDFPGRPISWYQNHQVHAIDVLHELATDRGLPDATRFRMRGGFYQAENPDRSGEWRDLTTPSAVYEEADRRARGVPPKRIRVYSRLANPLTWLR